MQSRGSTPHGPDQRLPEHWPLHRAVTVDIGIDDRGNTRILKRFGQIGDHHICFFGPAFGRNFTIARINAHGHMPWERRARPRAPSGFSTATVPKITRCNPLFSQFSIVAISRMPPPNCAGTLHSDKIASTGAALTGSPSNAPFRSTRCSHSHPASTNSRACAAGSVLRRLICPYPHATGARHCHLLGQSRDIGSWGYLIFVSRPCDMGR